MARASFNINISGIAQRVVLPPLPPFPVGRGVGVDRHRQQQLSEGLRHAPEQFWPFGLKLAGEDDFWQLPIEPMVSISGSNTIIRRNVAKTGTKSDVRGTVKERWSQDDYRISIVGILYNMDNPNEYPEADVARLRTYCEAQEAIQVSCMLFNPFNITQMVIESYDIPFTKGENAQAYSINGYSDALFELLIDMESR